MKSFVSSITQQLADDYKFTKAVIDGTDTETLTHYKQKMQAKSEQK